MKTIHPLFRIPAPSEDSQASAWQDLKERMDKLGRMQIKMQALLETDRSGSVASESSMEEMIQLLDGLDHCLSFLNDERAVDARRFRQGLELLRHKGLAMLESKDIHPIPSVGHRFDPRCHVAVDTVCREDIEDSTIVEEERRGYLRGDKPIRSAEVVVNRR